MIINLLSSKKNKLWMILVFIIFFRLPSIFVNYYDTDEIIYSICANEILNGGIPYIDYVEQKPPFIHYFYALIFFFFGENNIQAVHFFAILIVILTAYYIYKSVLALINDQFSAFMAFLAYGIYITAFDESYMATNGELLFNAPISIAIYHFIRYHFLNDVKVRYLLLISFNISFSVMIKQQSGIFLAFILLYLFLNTFLEKFKEQVKKNFLTALYICLIFILFILGFHILMYLGGFLKEAIHWIWIFPYNQFIVLKNAPLLDIIIKFLSRQGILFLVQIFLWISLISMIFQCISQKKGKTISKIQLKRFYLLLFFITFYIPIFLGGIRFHYHYFIQSLVPLSLIFGVQTRFFKEKFKKYYQLISNLLLIIPVLIFVVWHFHDLYKLYVIKFPVNERNKNYLIQRKEYRNLTQWIKTHSNKKDYIYVWGEAPSIYFFSKRRVGGRFFIFNYITLDYVNWLGKSTKNRSENKFTEFFKILLSDFKSKKPKYFIDTSLSALNGSENYPVSNYKNIYQYLLDNYYYKIQINSINVWERNF